MDDECQIHWRVPKAIIVISLLPLVPVFLLLLVIAIAYFTHAPFRRGVIVFFGGIARVIGGLFGGTFKAIGWVFKGLFVGWVSHSNSSLVFAHPSEVHGLV